MQLCTRMTGCVYCADEVVVTVPGMLYPSDAMDEQWELMGRVFNAPGQPFEQSPSRLGHPPLRQKRALLG